MAPTRDDAEPSEGSAHVSTAVLENHNHDNVTATVKPSPEELREALASMDPEGKDALGALLRENAASERVRISVSEARDAIRNAPLSEAWESSQLRELGRLVAATRLLVESGRRPEQVFSPLFRAAVAERIQGFVGAIPRVQAALLREAISQGVREARERAK